MKSAGISQQVGLLTAAILAVALVPLFIGAYQAKIYAPYILFVYVALGSVLFSLRRGFLTFLSPNSLVFFYTTLSLLLGSIAFNSGSVLVLSNFQDFSFHQYTHIALSFVLIGLIAMPLVELAHRPVKATDSIPGTISTSQFIVLILVTMPFLVLDFDLSLVGGSGSLNVDIISLLSVAVVYYASDLKFFTRYSVYTLTLFVLVLIFSHDKRIAIFLVATMAFLEVRRGFLKVNLRTFLIGGLGTVAVFFAIIVMSINRGYGGFVQDEGILESSRYISEYLGSDFFLSAFFQNIEVSYFFFHYFNSMELVLSGREPLHYGSTLIKPLFLPFPRDILPWKPDSIIDLYTMAHDPSFRYIGGSWLTSFSAEYMWNFHLFGILLFPVFAHINARLYRLMLSTDASTGGYAFLMMLFTYQNVLTYARGSGLDLVIFILLVAGIFIVVAAAIHALFFPAKRGRVRQTRV